MNKSKERWSVEYRPIPRKSATKYAEYASLGAAERHYQRCVDRDLPAQLGSYVLDGMFRHILKNHNWDTPTDEAGMTTADGMFVRPGDTVFVERLDDGKERFLPITVKCYGGRAITHQNRPVYYERANAIKAAVERHERGVKKLQRSIDALKEELERETECPTPCTN